MVNATLTFPSFLLNADWQGGPDQDGDNSRGSITWISAWSSVPMDPSAAWSTACTVPRIHRRAARTGEGQRQPPHPADGSPGGVNLRFGYIHDDGFKTEAPFPSTPFRPTAAHGVRRRDALQFRLQGGVIGMVTAPIRFTAKPSFRASCFRSSTAVPRISA
jgi:hypothetical protein